MKMQGHVLLVCLIIPVLRCDRFRETEIDEDNEKRSDCVPLSFNALMAQYKAQAGYNSMYMATTTNEAILFPNLLWNAKGQKKYATIVNNLTNTFKKVKNSGKPEVVLKFRNLIANKLNLSKRSNSVLTTIRKRQFNGRVTLSRTCTDPGDRDLTTKQANLCGQCSETTKLPGDRFPQYVNEVVCEHKKICFNGAGECKQNQRLTTFLVRQGCQTVSQNGQSVKVEKWVQSREFVRTSCECQMSVNSFLMKYVKNIPLVVNGGR